MQLTKKSSFPEKLTKETWKIQTSEWCKRPHDDNAHWIDTDLTPCEMTSVSFH